MSALKRERRPFEDREDDEDESSLVTIKPDGTVTRTSADKREDLAKLDEYMTRAHAMIMQINNLFNQWVAGIEPRPPHDRLTQLKFIMNGMEGLPKPTQAWRFRYDNIYHLYTVYKARWDKLMSDVEAGRVMIRKRK